MSDTPNPPVPTPAAPPARGPGTLQLGIVVAILAAGIALTALTSDVTRMSEPGIRLADDHPLLPPTAGEWTGSEQTGLLKEERDVLPADTDGARRAYTDKAGHTIYCSVVLSGRDVTSIHRPELCLTGQGWTLQPARPVPIAVAQVTGGELTVSRMNAERSLAGPNGQTAQAYSVFVYWFVGKDRTTPYHWQRIWWTTLDRVVHNRNHRWAYFLLSTIITPDAAGKNPVAAQDAAMQLVSRFVQEAYPQLTPN
ncbi:MAG: exosortase C-terminal domain/associated protein EpsI [Verrucomicrobiota bacterium]